jgi:hypothetical protein
MKLSNFIWQDVIWVCTLAVSMGMLAASAKALTIETVPVGDPGNPFDSSHSRGQFGAVDYAYNIGKYEVTSGQYVEFLNAVATVSDPNEVWKIQQDVGREGHPTFGHGPKIKRSGSPGSYSYSVPLLYTNRPVSFVDFGDAARFSNWMHNGQPTGPQDSSTTEDGAYDLTTGPFGGLPVEWSVTRKPGALWAIPSDDEWYKAAFYDPRSEAEGGPPGDDHYWGQATQSDAKPGYVADLNFVNVVDANGKITFADPSNYATYNGDDPATGFGPGSIPGIGDPWWFTEVGEWENSPSYYGTFDQAGNVSEWNEAFDQRFGGELPAERGTRGGHYYYSKYMAANTFLITNSPTHMGKSELGFRLVDLTVVPISCASGCSWESSEGGNWGSVNNWEPGGIPDGNDHTATLGGAIQTLSTVFTDLDRTLANLTFDNAAATHIVAGTGTLHFEGAQVTPAINVMSGSHELQARVKLLGDTTADVASDSTLTFNNLLDLNGNTLTKRGLGEIAINNTLLPGTGGTFTCAEGTCSGAAISGNVVNSGGTISPGHSPGIMEIKGDYTQGDGGTLLIELAGTNMGVDHDLLDVAGTAQLDGALQVVLLDGFRPQLGDVFDVLEFDSLTSVFDEVAVPALTGSLGWDTSALYTKGSLSIIPEPQTILLLLLGVLALALPAYRQPIHKVTQA